MDYIGEQLLVSLAPSAPEQTATGGASGTLPNDYFMRANPYLPEAPAPPGDLDWSNAWGVPALLSPASTASSSTHPNTRATSTGNSPIQITDTLPGEWFSQTNEACFLGAWPDAEFHSSGIWGPNSAAGPVRQDWTSAHSQNGYSPSLAIRQDTPVSDLKPEQKMLATEPPKRKRGRPRLYDTDEHPANTAAGRSAGGENDGYPGLNRRATRATAASSPAEDKTKTRTRNRLAAQRYRNRIQTKAAELEEGRQQLSSTHESLVACAKELNEEVYKLKMEVFRHSSCDCPLIQNYLSHAAHNLTFGSPWPPALAKPGTTFAYGGKQPEAAEQVGEAPHMDTMGWSKPQESPHESTWQACGSSEY